MKKGYLMVRVSAVGMLCFCWSLMAHVGGVQRYIEKPTNEELVNRLKAGYRNTEEWLANAASMKWTWDKADFIRDPLPNSDMRELSLWPKYMKNGQWMTVSPFELWSFCNHFFERINAAEIQKGEELCCILHCYYEADNNKIVSTENLTDAQLWAKVKEEFELSEKLKNKTQHLRKEFSVKYETLKQNKGRCSANPIVLSNRSFEPAKNEVNPKKTVDVQEICRILKQDFDRQDEAFEKKRKEEAKKQQEFERKLQLAQQSGDLRAIIEAYRSDPAIDYLKNALTKKDNETSGGMLVLRESDFPKGHWKEKYDYKLKEHKFPGKLYSFEYPGGKESFTAIVLDTPIETSGHSGIKMDALVSLRADGKVTRLTDVF